MYFQYKSAKEIINVEDCTYLQTTDLQYLHKGVITMFQNEGDRKKSDDLLLFPP